MRRILQDAGRCGWRVWVAAVLLGAACSPPGESPSTTSREAGAGSELGGRPLDPPASSASLAPVFSIASGELLLSWLEALPGPDASPRHRLVVSRLTDGRWSEPAEIASGSEFFANWADLPAVAAAADGTLIAHWLAKTASDTYAYSIFLARSLDGGRVWEPFGRLNDDQTPTEHGFVSWVSEGRALRAFWLDGRGMLDGRPMTLRTAAVTDRVGPSEVLDERVCECCSTDAALGAAGPLVVFRDRSSEEIRDVAVVRREGDAWSATEPVAVDGWEIAGCPVNGPAVAADAASVVVAWFSAAEQRPSVQYAFSEDAAGSFGEARRVDGGEPLGRVDVLLDGTGGAVVSWLERAADAAEIRVRRVTRDGPAGPARVVSRTSPARASGFPRLARTGDSVWVAWVDVEGDSASRIRVREIPWSSL